MPAPWLKAVADGVRLEVLAVPRSSRNKVVGAHDGRLKIQLAAPPVDGEANAALCAALSEWLSIPRRAVEVTAGATGRRKSVLCRGVTVEEAERALSEV